MIRLFILTLLLAPAFGRSAESYTAEITSYECLTPTIVGGGVKQCLGLLQSIPLGEPPSDNPFLGYQATEAKMILDITSDIKTPFSVRLWDGNTTCAALEFFDVNGYRRESSCARVADYPIGRTVDTSSIAPLSGRYQAERGAYLAIQAQTDIRFPVKALITSSTPLNAGTYTIDIHNNFSFTGKIIRESTSKSGNALGIAKATYTLKVPVTGTVSVNSVNIENDGRAFRKPLNVNIISNQDVLKGYIKIRALNLDGSDSTVARIGNNGKISIENAHGTRIRLDGSDNIAITGADTALSVVGSSVGQMDVGYHTSSLLVTFTAI